MTIATIWRSQSSNTANVTTITAGTGDEFAVYTCPCVCAHSQAAPCFLCADEHVNAGRKLVVIVRIADARGVGLAEAHVQVAHDDRINGRGVVKLDDHSAAAIAAVAACRHLDRGCLENAVGERRTAEVEGAPAG